MMAKSFDKMVKKELQEAAVFLKLDGKVLELAKDSNNPTNAEYVEVLEAFKAEQDANNPEEAKSAAIKTVTEKDPSIINPKATKEEEVATMIADYDVSIPVIITDHETGITIEDDSENRTVAISWGNPIIGMTTTNVPLHGRMQYVVKGAIQRMKRIPKATTTTDAEGNTVVSLENKRFSISDTTGWTPAEFEAHAKEQALKKL